MKLNPDVTSSRRKCRRAHLAAPSHIKQRLMSFSLAKDLKAKYGIKSVPIRKGDEVKIMRGEHKGQKGKVTQVYRKKWAVYVQKRQKTKANGQAVPIPFDASKLMVLKLAASKSRTAKLQQTKAKLDAVKLKGKGKKSGAD